MNIKAISLDIGKALQVNALFMLLALIVSVLYGMDSGFTPLLISFLITVIAGSFPMIFIKDAQQDTLQDGFITIVLSWLLSFIFGMLPYVLWGGEFTLMNAWFESVSGYTTTGSTILTDIEALPASLLFWRSSTHFIGGLGVIIFLLLILPDTSSFKFKLSHLELSSIAKEGYRYKSGKTVRVIVTVYIVLTIAETLCLWAAGMTLFDAVNHAFSTVATGGFSTRNLSIMHYDSNAINIILMVFMTLSAMHFGVIYSAFATRSLRPLKQPVTRYYLAVIAVLSILVTLSLLTEKVYDSFGEALMAGTFQVISYITTTGFGQADNAAWPVLTGALLMFAAVHCGCSGSTTGGIKADRVYTSLPFIHIQDQSRIRLCGRGDSFRHIPLYSTVYNSIVRFICNRTAVRSRHCRCLYRHGSFARQCWSGTRKSRNNGQLCDATGGGQVHIHNRHASGTSGNIPSTGSHISDIQKT